MSILLTNSPNQMITTNEISVSEALHKIDSGESIKAYTISFDHIKVEALDVMKLAKHGIVVPDEAVYYNDDDIVMDDDDFAGEWKRIDYDPVLTQEAYVEVKINLNKDIKNWVETQNIQLPELLENLLDGFYRTQRSISKVK
ncbi:hypothetical protein [Haliscomenobacter hydrossis]|nr:hypothetical protein [Haliscomenobacter hydrossis]